MTERIFRKPTLVPRRRDKTLCPCRKVYVIEQTRQLECQHCGRIIEPFDYIFKLSEQQNLIDLNIRAMYQEKQNLIQQVEELKRERRNLRAQINRAKKKLEG